MPRVNDPFERQHIANLSKYAKIIDEIFKTAAKEAASIGVIVGNGNFDASRVFSFADYPITHKMIQSLLSRLANSVETAIVNGVEAEWTLANNKNNELSRRVFGDNVGKLTQEQYRKYFSSNDEAREAFLARKEQGLNLSERVWRYTECFKSDIELGLDIGIRNGLDAAQMSRQLRQFLQHPDMLFRRVRDEHGNLVLSKRASDFHPGRGVYRSSYKNARRLAVTETNMAYRSADYERMQQLDFVVGIEIRLSNNHTTPGKNGLPIPLVDICDELKGKYPKDFKFTSWHPHCRCYVVSILKTESELMQENAAILRGEEPNKGSANKVEDVPKNFKDWLEQNSDRINKAKGVPYFLRDNAKYSGVYSPKYGAVGLLTGTKLGRAATREALKIYEDFPAPTISAEQKSNIEEIAKKLNARLDPPMTFIEANEGRGNMSYGKGEEFESNCQVCVAIHEARLRGLNVTAVGYTDRKDSVQYLLGESFQDIWINPKTGKIPNVTTVRDVNFDVLTKKLDKNTSAIGRYHIGINMKNSGHVITAERLPNGKLIFYDAQSGTFLNIEEYATLEVENFEILKVDKLLLNQKMFKSIAKVL